MNITLLLFAACSIILPESMTAQELSGASTSGDSATMAYVSVKANRVGISADTIDVVTPHPRSDSAASGVHVVDHIRHAVIGGFWGFVGGAAIGAGAGAIADARAEEVMIPATAIGAVMGGVGGLVLGLLIGVAWPVK
jgi:hypothetical protein